MRFVTALIITMLVATVYIANMAPGKKEEESSRRENAAVNGASRSGQDRDVAMSNGLSIDERDLPVSFPAELTQRSRGAGTPLVSSDSPIADADRNPFLMDVDEAARRREEEPRRESSDAAPLVVDVGDPGPSDDQVQGQVDPVVTEVGVVPEVDPAAVVARSTGAPVPVPAGVVPGSGEAPESGPGARNAPDPDVDVATVPDLPREPSRDAVDEVVPADPESLQDSASERSSVPSARRGPVLREPAPVDTKAVDSNAEPEPLPDGEATRDSADAAVPEVAKDSAGEAQDETTGGPEPVKTKPVEPAPKPTGKVAGRVNDTGGEPTSSVTVEAYDASTGTLLASVKSGRDGRFTMDGLPESNVSLRVAADSVPLGLAAPSGQETCRTGDEPVGYGAVCVTPKAGSAAPASIVLPYSSGVQGTVVGAGGKAMGGAMVRAVSKVDGFTNVKALATTDREGFFFLTLVPGPYELQIAPPESAKGEHPQKVQIEAEAGSAIVMDTIDLTKVTTDQDMGGPLPAQKLPAEPRVAEASTKRNPTGTSSPKKLATTPTEAPAQKPTEKPAATPVSLPVAEAVVSDSSAPLIGSTGVVMPGVRAIATVEEGEVALTGRVISTWGEVVDGIHLVVTDTAGKVHSEGYTNAEGKYLLTGVPIGDCTVAMAPNAPLGKRGSRGLIVRVRPKPVAVRSFPGQERVVVEDQVVDVAPIFRIEGKIEVSPKSFETFKRDLIARDAGMEKLGDERILRIYLRGLQLVQKNTGGKGKARPVAITPDGSFQWACSLPAEDVLFVLSPRSSLPGRAYDGPVGVEVTPAGVRTAKLTIQYPPQPKKKPPVQNPPVEKPEARSPGAADVAPKGEAAPLAEGSASSL